MHTSSFVSLFVDRLSPRPHSPQNLILIIKAPILCLKAPGGWSFRVEEFGLKEPKTTFDLTP